MSTGTNGTALEPITVGSSIVLDSAPDPVSHVLARVAHVDEIISQLMKPDTHYGKIPGCQKLSLWQPGAEALAMAFQFRPRFEFQINDNPFGHEGHREVIATCRIENADGRVLTEAFGSCSTLEAKYRWRSGIACQTCGEPIRESKKKRGEWYCWKKTGGCGWVGEKPAGASEERRENPDLADEFHTVLAMARKRALVLAVKTVLAASDRFTETDDDHGRGSYDDPPPVDAYDDAPPPAPRYIQKAQAWQQIKAAMAGREVTTDDLKAHMAQAKLAANKLTRADVDTLVKWASSQPIAELLDVETMRIVAERLAAVKGHLGAVAHLRKAAAAAGIEDPSKWPASEWPELLDAIAGHVLPDAFDEIRGRVAPELGREEF